MPEQEPIVIVGPDGTEYEFPAGMDPKKAAVIVRGQAAGAQSSRAATPQPQGALQRLDALMEQVIPNLPQVGAVPAPIGRAVANQIYQTVRHPIENAPTLAAMAAAPFTGGLSTIPAMATVAGAGLAGTGLRSLAKGEKPTATELAMGAGQGVLEGAGRALPAMAKGMQTVGRKLVRGSFRSALSDIRKMAEFRTMSERQVADQMANIAHRERIRTTPRGLLKTEQAIEDVDRQTGQLVEQAGQVSVQGDPRSILRAAARQVMPRLRRQNVPQDDVASARITLKKFAENPAVSAPRMVSQTKPSAVLNAQGQPFQMTTQVQKGRKLVPTDIREIYGLRRGSNTRLRGKFGEMKSAEVEAEKALSAAEGAAIRRAVPETDALMKREHDLLNLQTVLGRRVFNAGNFEPVRLYEFLGMLRGDPKAMALGALSRPGVSSTVGHGLWSAGANVGGLTPTSLAQMMRAALMGQMLGEEDQQVPPPAQ